MLTHAMRVKKLLTATDRAFALALNNPMVIRDILFAVLVTDSRVLEPDVTELMRNLLARVRDILMMEQAEWEANKTARLTNSSLNPRSRFNRRGNPPGGTDVCQLPGLSDSLANSRKNTSSKPGGASDASSPSPCPSSPDSDSSK